MNGFSLRTLIVSTLLVGSIVSVTGCSSETASEEEEVGEAAEGALTQSGGTTTLYYLGSSSFLRQCAGNTLGCGRAVASVSDSTPYFSAPRTWSRSTCDDWYTFRVNGRCVEAQRLEVSDRRNFIEGNPGLFRGLGLQYSDGRNCAGSGTHRGVRVTPGRTCGSSSGTTPAPAPAPDTDTDTDGATAGAGSCWSGTLEKTVAAGTCVESKFDGVWFQCNGGKWYRGVTGSTGPFGPCTSTHPLP